MLLPKHLPSNPILSSKREFPLNFPRIDKLPPKDAKFLQVQELSFPNTAFQNLIDPDGNTSHITKTINPSKINNTLSKHTNERFLKGMLNQRNISPLEQHIGGVNDQKKNNTSFQVVSREIKKNESRENSRGRPVKSPIRDYNINNNVNNLSLITNIQKKETKTNNLIKIYNPSPINNQSQPKKPNNYRVSSKKDKKKSKEELPQSETKKPSSFNYDDPTNYFLNMSFGNKELQKAMGIDIQQILDKELNNKNSNTHNEEGSTGKNINIIGNVNYENINFNFTFAKNECHEPRKEERLSPKLSPNKIPNKRKSFKANDKNESNPNVFRSPYSENEMSFNQINLKEHKTNTNANTNTNKNNNTLNVGSLLENYNNLNLRETPTFTLPLQYYKERSECKEIFSPEELQEDSLTKILDNNKKVEPPSIYSHDFLLDDLMEDLKKNGLFKYVNDSIQIESPPQEKEEKEKAIVDIVIKKESPKSREPLKSVMIANKENRKDKCLLIDFDNDEVDSEEDLVLSKDHTQKEIPENKNNNFKVIKYKNMEVLDLNDI